MKKNKELRCKILRSAYTDLQNLYFWHYNTLAMDGNIVILSE